MTPLRRSLVAFLAGGIALTGPAALGAPASTVGPETGTPAPLSGPAQASSAASSGEDDTVGRWRVTPQADGSYTVSWESPDPLPITDDRPTFQLDGSPYAIPELDADGTTLSIEVPADSTGTVPDPDRLDVELSGRVLDAPDATATAPARRAVIDPLPGTASLTPDPGVAGSHPIARRDYSLPDVKLAGMPAKVEMEGHVVWPSDMTPGSAPLVLFLHGRHEACYRVPHAPGPRFSEWPCPRNTKPIPSNLGYEYVQDRLATQGYVSVSIAANGINAQDWRLVDGGAAARARLVQKHLAAWANPADAAGIGDAATIADLANVVLVGHSRGGEGVNRASAQIPLAAPYRVTGQILIGPTDFGRQTAPYVPSVTILPYCDGDVSDLQGQAFTDLARDYAPDDTALHSSLLVLGANHNFFNTEWTPRFSTAPSSDDWAFDDTGTCSYGSTSRLTKVEQQRVGRSYIAGAVQLMARGDDAMLPLFDGSRVSLASAGDTDVRSHAVGLDRATRAPGRGAVLATSLQPQAKTQLCVGRAGTGVPSTWCGRGIEAERTPHWPGSFPGGQPTKRAFEMRWTASGQEGGLRFTQLLNLAGRSLHLRTIADAVEGTAHLSVRVVDDSGRAAVVQVPAVRALPLGDFVLGKQWAQDVVVDGANVSTANPNLDLARIREVDLIAGDARGRVWVLDVAAGDGTLPAPLAKRTATLTLESLAVPEGDGIRKTTARLPFHITGDVSRPTKFLLSAAGFFGFRIGRPISVTVAAGVHDGTIPVPYQPNRRDDLARRVYDLAAYGISGAMPTDYTAKLTVLDDDPTPRMWLVPRRSGVREGGVARWTLRLSKPLNYYDTAIVTVGAGPSRTPGLRGNDVPRSWLRQQGATNDRPQRPLDQLDVFLGATLRPGQRTVTFSIPTRRDRTGEGTEHVTIKALLSQAHRRDSSTIQVLDAPRR